MQLQQGQIVYKIHPMHMSNLTVDRVTKTQAILSNGAKLRREYHDPNWLREINPMRWSQTRYSLASEELDRKYYEQTLRRWLENNYKDFAVEQIEAVYKLVKSYEKEIQKVDQESREGSNEGD